jgi:glucose-specific phosphotransferase system IIA component
MFKLFKKQKTEIVSPAAGVLNSITEVPDQAFASKMMGDGFIVTPETGDIFSPVDGTVAMIFPTGHALGLRCADGTELLIHIGVDTVALNGEGFEKIVSEGQNVKKGDLIARFDLEGVKAKVPSTDIIIVFTTGEACEVLKAGKRVAAGEAEIVDYKKQ